MYGILLCIFFGSSWSFADDAVSRRDGTLKVVGIQSVTSEEWQMVEGRFLVESYLVELASGESTKVGNPVRLRTGFQIGGKSRFDLSHQLGTVSVDISPEKNGAPDIKGRRIIEVQPGKNQVEFDLPPGKYIAGVLASSGNKSSGGMDFSFIKFEVMGPYNQTKVPPLLYKDLDRHHRDH